MQLPLWKKVIGGDKTSSLITTGALSHKQKLIEREILGEVVDAGLEIRQTNGAEHAKQVQVTTFAGTTRELVTTLPNE